MLNGYVAVKVDQHYRWYLNSKGEPFLEREHNIYDVWMHMETSGVVMAAPETPYPGYDKFTDIEIQEGDRVIFNYLAINRDRDGNDVNMQYNGWHILKYSDMYARIRDGVVTPLNGWAIVKGLEEEIKTTLIIPDFVKERKSKMFCEIIYLGSPVKQHLDPPYCDWAQEDEDEFEVGQKVIIPKWAAVPLQKEEHAIIKGDGIYRVRRQLMTDYNTVMHYVQQSMEASPRKEPDKATFEAFKNFRCGSTEPTSTISIGIHHKLRTKYLKHPKKFYMS